MDRTFLRWVAVVLFVVATVLLAIHHNYDLALISAGLAAFASA